MKRKKKKNSSPNKQEFRHNCNEFLKKMKNVIAPLGDVSAFNLLDKTELTILHHCRLRPYKIINPNGQSKVSSYNLRFINNKLSDLLHKSFIEVGKSKTKISLYDFSVYVETLYLIWRNMPEDNPKIATEFQACFPFFNEDYKNTRKEAFVQIKKNLSLLAWLYSDFTNNIIRFVQKKIEKKSSPFDNSAFYNNLIIDLKQAKTELLTIDGNKRRVYQIHITKNQEFVDFTIPPENLGITKQFPIKVFIQQHALNRIGERIGKLFMYLSYLFIITAILRDPIPIRNKNSFLFPLTHNNIKLGYLKGDITTNKLVIRTFLFITNNGTPEGNKLHNLVGLQKIDKKFLGIDKLSTFILSDIKENEKLKALFYQAGCGDLFKLDRSILDQPNKKEIACAEYLIHYLDI